VGGKSAEQIIKACIRANFFSGLKVNAEDMLKTKKFKKRSCYMPF
jgi:hypothetical protein